MGTFLNFEYLLESYTWPVKKKQQREHFELFYKNANWEYHAKKSFPDISGSVKYNFFSGHSFSGKLKYANWSCFDIFTVLEDDNTVAVGNMANKNRNNIN